MIGALGIIHIWNPDDRLVCLSNRRPRRLGLQQQNLGGLWLDPRRDSLGRYICAHGRNLTRSGRYNVTLRRYRDWLRHRHTGGRRHSELSCDLLNLPSGNRLPRRSLENLLAGSG